MPPIQNTEAKNAAQHNHINSGDQRNKNSNGVISNGTKNNSTNNNNNNNNTHYSQQLIQTHNRRMGPQPTVTSVPMSQYSGAAAAAVSTSSSHRYHHHPPNSAASQPTPLFQRLHSEEVQSVHQELKAYKRIVESQNLRLLELEKIHEDLEKRLELESRGRRQLETTLERRERDWTIKLHTLEKDIDHWENEVSNEQAKNSRLRDQVVRKDQDIHRMLQRKYDNQRESVTGQPIRNMRHSERQSQGSSPRQTQHKQDHSQQRLGAELNKSPHEILATTGSIESVRIRNVKTLVADFFAF